MSRLQELVVSHLRGSVVPFTLPFEKGKKLTVIYGENGTGKSTLCDAFEFLGNGKVSSLDGRGIGQTHSFWPSLGKVAQDVSVTLETAAGTFVGTLRGSTVTVAPIEDRPKVSVLRRSQILDLIEATPADRYGTIKPFIDVDGIEKSETTLRDLIRATKSGRDTAVARVQENRDAIMTFWESSDRPGQEAFAWAKSQVDRDVTSLVEEGILIETLIEKFSQLRHFRDQIEATLDSLNAATEALRAAELDNKSLFKESSEEASDLLAILEAAQGFLEHQPDPKTCPLCESPEKVATLRASVSDRLKKSAKLRSAKAKLVSAQATYDHAVQSAELLDQNVAKASLAFEEHWKAGRQWPDDVIFPNASAPTGCKGLGDWLHQNQHLVEGWKRAEEARSEQTRFTTALKAAYETWQSNTQDQQDIDRLLPRLEAALEIVESERKAFTDSLLASVAEEVGRLYEVVHPGEGLSQVSLKLHPTRRGSLEMSSHFCGKETQPQAYFSDSHLDTLGLCIFLALAALEEQEHTILVLDDVLASVDEPHVERLIEMLYEEAIKYRHCLITTHYRPWKQKLKWGWLKNGQCQFVELQKWTATGGLSIVRSVPDLDRLAALLAENPPDAQLVCAKAGVVLEAALDFLTLQYECRVPRRKDGLYTLGDLLPAMDNKLRGALRIEKVSGKDAQGNDVYEEKPLGPILDELARIAQVRNVFGCHFNAISFELLDSDALPFGALVLELMETLTDGEAGWPRNGNSGEYWATAGKTRKMHPYARPQ